MNDKPHESRPSALWYLAPVAVMAVAVVVFIASLGVAGSEVRRDVAAMPRVVFPGGGAVDIEDPGEVTLYYETRSVVDGQEVVGERPQRRIELRVTTPSGNTEEATNIHWREEGAYDAKAIYDLPTYSGFGAWKYTASQRGTYHLSAAFSDTTAGRGDGGSPASEQDEEAKLPTFAVAVGDIDLQEHFSSWTGLFGAAAIVAAAMVVAVALAVLVYVKRNRDRWSRSDSA